MLTKTQAIVLHSLKYGETRLIVDMFTRSQGRQSFIVSIPKSVKGKIKKQLFQPLTLLEIESDLRPKLQLQKLSDVRLASPFSSIPFDPNKLSISLFIAEFLYYALRSEQHNEPLFDYIVNSIQWLDSIWCFSCDSPVFWVSIRISTTIRLAITSTFVRAFSCQRRQYIATSFILRKQRRYN